MAFENLELKEAFCFGWCPRARTEAWYNLAIESVTTGWKNANIEHIDQDLKTNVDTCYFFICRGTFEDLDTGMKWQAQYINDHGLWLLTLPEGDGAEVLPEDAKAFFSCEYFKKFAKRCGDLIARAVDCYHEVIEQHLTGGELMSVDPVKLERIMFVAENAKMTDNLRNGKYELK